MLAAGLFEGFYTALSPGQDFLAIADKSGRLRTFDTGAFDCNVQRLVVAYLLTLAAYLTIQPITK